MVEMRIGNKLSTGAGVLGKQKALRRWNEAWVCVLGSSVGLFPSNVSQRAMSKAEDVAPTMQAIGNKYFHSF